MTMRTRTRPVALAITFEREGEPSIRVEAPNSKAAISKTMAILIARELQPGDRLTVTAAE